MTYKCRLSFTGFTKKSLSQPTMIRLAWVQSKVHLNFSSGLSFRWRIQISVRHPANRCLRVKWRTRSNQWCHLRWTNLLIWLLRLLLSCNLQKISQVFCCPKRTNTWFRAPLKTLSLSTRTLMSRRRRSRTRTLEMTSWGYWNARAPNQGFKNKGIIFTSSYSD
jgi:hypothetical protein